MDPAVNIAIHDQEVVRLCLNEVRAVLKRHGCVILPKVEILGGMIKTDWVVVLPPKAPPNLRTN